MKIKTDYLCRNCETPKFNIRAEETGDLYINGYFSVFNSNYEIMEGITENVASTAFDDVLNDDIRCLIDHDTRLVLGRTKSGTLTLRIDDYGLWGEVKINTKDIDALNLYERVKRGDVDQCSFGFDIIDEEFSDNGTTAHWTIKKVKLYEVSVVTFPAYEDTNVTARKEQLKNSRKREIETYKQKCLNKLKGA